VSKELQELHQSYTVCGTWKLAGLFGLVKKIAGFLGGSKKNTSSTEAEKTASPHIHR